MSPVVRREYIAFLKSIRSEERLARLEEVLDCRTRYFTVLLENIWHPHNASAVLRSCDCFGIQDVHLVDDHQVYEVNKKVTMGATKWLTLNRYYRQSSNSERALKALKKRGYRIVATTPHEGAVSLSDFDVTGGPAAFVFGTEMTGISDTVRALADEYLSIPMVGFTESLNISVSVAIILQQLGARLRASEVDWRLPDEERELLLLEWLRKSTQRIGVVEESFFEERG